MLFNNYDKPGKGVPKNEPEKLGIVIYGETAARKFWKLIQAGLLFTLFSIPWMLVLYAGAYFVLRTPITLAIGGMDETQAAALASMICATVSLLIAALWGSGPLSAAFSFVMRSFIREEPIWLMSDGKDAAKENMKQGFLVMLTDAAVLALAGIASESYWTLAGSMPAASGALGAMSCILLLMLMLYTIMHPYIYQLMITFDCAFKELYRNALLLALAKLPLNVLFMLIGAAVIIVPIWIFGIYPIFAAIILMSVGFIVTRFPSELYAVRVIKREMLERK